MEARNRRRFIDTVSILIEILIAAAVLVCGARRMLPFGGLPVLVVMGGVSLWLRHEGLRGIGLGWRCLTPMTALLGGSFGVVYQAVSLFALEPLTVRLTGARPDLTAFSVIHGNVRLLLLSLASAWTVAAFGEEFVFRGYLLNRIAQWRGGRRAGLTVGVALSALLWALGHLYQGVGGVALIAVHGLTFGLLYVLTSRNLWMTIVTHGAFDTTAFLLIFLGRYPNMGGAV